MVRLGKCSHTMLPRVQPAHKLPGWFYGVFRQNILPAAHIFRLRV
ncbi:hypothetical protein HMPREF0742_02080 [Rothia aeria F0184]|uniref:Uncharacterized protein n=1 Tax=Rothia aeria F0184 TaxID=888019 RepID=U7V0Z0_9MICC|nr:hypothetical protein HMPREF0742_02080 [Rothia aeria F0184]